MRKEGLVFKKDLEKAYDHVDWDLVDNMFRFGFGDRWCKWMRVYFINFFISVGQWIDPPFRFLQASRGVRHGDPLSLVLFTIVAEAMSALLVRGKYIGLFRGFETGNNGEVISHL